MGTGTGIPLEQKWVYVRASNGNFIVKRTVTRFKLMHKRTYIYRLLSAVILHGCKIQPRVVALAMEYVIYCACMVEEKGQMKKLMEETVEGWHGMEDEEEVVVVVYIYACESAEI